MLLCSWSIQKVRKIMSHEGPSKSMPQEAVNAPVGNEAVKTKEASWKKMQEWIAELQSTSKFSREKTPDGREKIRNPEGEEFFIRRVTDPKDPTVKKIHQFLVKAFTAEEADTFDTIQGAVSSDYQAYHVIEDASGKMVALSNTAYLELERKKGKSKDAIIFDAYLVTDSKQRGKGLGRELYQNTYQHALKKAKAAGSGLRGIVGEAVNAVEPFMNRLGSRRVYFEDGQGNLREAPYIQTPVDWDPKTGKNLQEATPEHLMLRLTDGKQELSSGELLTMVRAIYDENYVFPEEFFKSKKALERCEQIVGRYVEELKAALGVAKNDRLFLLSKEEREQKRKDLAARGKKLIEHKTSSE